MVAGNCGAMLSPGSVATLAADTQTDGQTDNWTYVGLEYSVLPELLLQNYYMPNLSVNDVLHASSHRLQKNIREYFL